MLDGVNIHFICRGNVLRSLIAETYLKSLKLEGIDVISSGTNVNWNDSLEREYFANTLRVLKNHGIDSFAKSVPNQLDQTRITGHSDLVVMMNRRVVDEANMLVELPVSSIRWGITDIGEGNRTTSDQRGTYEEEIYQEIVHKVDELLLHYR